MTDQFGSFGNQCFAGGFEPDLSRMHPFDPVMGMPLGIQWLYAFLQDEDGLIYCPERKFISTLTGGLFLMSNETGTLNINPISGRGYRGELRRVNDPDHRRWHNPVFHRMPPGTVPEAEQDFILDLRDDRMEYSEGNLIDLAGPSCGLGMQFYNANPECPLFYSSLAYWLEGEALGKKVEGPFFFDHVYWPAGRDWKEYVYYLDKQIGWEVFANKYDDGTIQWGHFVNGKDGFNPGVVVEGDKVIAASGNVTGEFVLNDQAGCRRSSATSMASGSNSSAARKAGCATSRSPAVRATMTISRSTARPGRSATRATWWRDSPGSSASQTGSRTRAWSSTSSRPKRPPEASR